MGVQNSNAEASYNENQTDGDSGFSKEVSGEEKHFIIEKVVSRTEQRVSREERTAAAFLRTNPFLYC